MVPTQGAAVPFEPGGEMFYNVEMSKTAASPGTRPGKYHIATYGCQMNAHESEKIAGVLEAMGLVRTGEAAQADVIVLNTCTIRESAEQRIIGHIGTLKKLKQRNPNLRIAVVGCLTQDIAAAQRLRRTFPFLDVILGTQDVHRLEEALNQAGAVTEHVDRRLLNDAVDKRDDISMARAAGPSAQVNIMYGCDNYCSYCIVPHVRGPERSRSAASILGELKELECKGYREVQLLGQNVNSYRDDVDFTGLLEQVLQETSFARIRFMTSHPKDLSDRLIQLIGTEKRLCSHVHLPLQSGSDNVLARMNRGYTWEEYLTLTERLRSGVPDVSLTTDLIVGFPGETDADFTCTLEAVDAVQFQAAYTFVYSARQGTPAAAMDDQVPREVKKDRIVQLIERQNSITRALNEAQVGRLEEVLVSGKASRGNGDMTGRTDAGRTVNFAGSTNLVGQIVPIRITEAKSTTLYGRLEAAAWQN